MKRPSIKVRIAPRFTVAWDFGSDEEVFTHRKVVGTLDAALRHAAMGMIIDRRVKRGCGVKADQCKEGSRRMEMGSYHPEYDTPEEVDDRCKYCARDSVARMQVRLVRMWKRSGWFLDLKAQCRDTRTEQIHQLEGEVRYWRDRHLKLSAFAGLREKYLARKAAEERYAKSIRARVIDEELVIGGLVRRWLRCLT